MELKITLVVDLSLYIAPKSEFGAHTRDCRIFRLWFDTRFAVDKLKEHSLRKT